MKEEYKGSKLEKQLNQIKDDESSDTQWLEERIILLGPSGSYAKGTNTQNSDKDYKGVCVPPIDYYLGLKAFNEYNTTGGKNFKNTKEDIDIIILHINKFVHNAKNTPDYIDMLFLRPNDYIKLTELGQILIDNRHLFLSKDIYRAYKGSANKQKQIMIRKEYDTKCFMQAVLFLTSGMEILETGDYSTFRPNREFLLECRNGAFTYEQALKIIDDFDKQLEEAYEKCTILPETTDYQKINQLLIDINKRALYL